MAPQAGYEREIVLAFVEAHGTKRDDGRLQALNERRLTESHKEMLKRWEDWDLISLAKVDALLIQYELMLFELEDWARKEFGRDGFTDPVQEPAELAI